MSADLLTAMIAGNGHASTEIVHAYTGRSPENSGRPMRSLTRLIDLVWGSLPLILFLLAIALASFRLRRTSRQVSAFPLLHHCRRL